MSKIKGHYEFVSQDPIYTSKGNWGFEVRQEDPIKGTNYYLIDSDNNIILGPEHIDGTSLFEKGQDFFIKNKQDIIIGVATIIIVGGVALFLTKNPTLSKAICQISAKEIKNLISFLVKSL